MRKLFILIAVMCLVLPSFPAAQEADEQTETVEAGEVLSDNEIVSDTEKLEEEVEEIVDDYNINNLTRVLIALGIIAVQILLIWLIWKFFKHLDHKMVGSRKEKIKPLTIHNLKLLTSKQVIAVIQGFLHILKYVVTVLLLFLTLPLVFSLFPATRNLAFSLIGHVLNPLKEIGIGILKYLPNLVPIIIIIVISRYLLRALRFFTNQIDKGKLVIPHFYHEWAAPTYKILQVLIWAFAIALVYPYLPGSDSKAFQGVSVFVGVIFSLGSTSAIGNLVAGLVITYMRPFKIGDRVQIKEITGFVVEKNMMVVRLKTHKNEYVTFPNLMILNSNIINYNTSSDEDEEGLIIYSELTCGYDTPWQSVHDIMINAALKTEHVLKKPKPFMLQTKLDDFYAYYQINCYTKEVSKVPGIIAELNENIQDGFKEAGLDITSSHFRVITTQK